jgi:hypothetical protein
MRSSINSRVKSRYTVADLRDFHGLPDVRPFEEDVRAKGLVVDSGTKFLTASAGLEIIGV